MEEIFRVEDIHKSFGDNHVHKGINFKLFKGECLGLLGNSGTGKSVLLRSLIGLEQIDSGKIFFNNKRIDGLEEEEWFKVRCDISYAFQSGALFDSMSVFENLAYPLYEHTDLDGEDLEKAVFHALKVVGLEGKDDLMPSDLSGGMKKRVGLARSLILNPGIILYDEPTAGLDPANVEKIVGIMQSLKDNGKTSIFVTHDISAARKICDRILIIDDGKIFFEGTPAQMMASSDPKVEKFFTMEKKREAQ
jgi:phospholipid/cholesterol/gamma-HCH transport system ATP-binding protein